MLGRLRTGTEIVLALCMRRAVETGIWNDDDRSAFLDFIADNPDLGDVILETGGILTRLRPFAPLINHGDISS